jgi:hypothetical protein
MIFSNYHLTNLLIADFTIFYSMFLSYLVIKNDIKNSFKIAMSFINPAFCFITLLIAIFMNNNFFDNWALLALIIVLVIQLLIFLIALQISKSIK